MFSRASVQSLAVSPGSRRLVPGASAGSHRLRRAGRAIARSWTLPPVKSVPSPLAAFNPFRRIGEIAHRKWGHRGFLHSPAALLWFGLLLIPLALLWSLPVALALWLGFASHLAADALTPAGIPFRAGSGRRLHLLPRRLWIVTGSDIEEIVLALLLALCAGACSFRAMDERQWFRSTFYFLTPLLMPHRSHAALSPAAEPAPSGAATGTLAQFHASCHPSACMTSTGKNSRPPRSGNWTLRCGNFPTPRNLPARSP